MTLLRRRATEALVLLCVALGVVLILLALDVRTWRTTTTRDDLRFRALPGHRALWQTV